MRRILRVSLVLPLVAVTWIGVVKLAGDVAVRDGGPMPVGDLTVEAATLLAIALCASSLGARVTSDRLGGVVAAPILLGLVAIALFLPPDQKMILGSPSHPRWEDAHEWWRAALVLSGAAFLWLNRSPGSYPPVSRLRALRRAPRIA